MTEQQVLARISAETVEKLSSSLNEPRWLKDFRMESLESFNSLPPEQSSLYTKYSPELQIDLTAVAEREKPTPHRSAPPISEIAQGMETGYYYVATQTETIASKNIQDLRNEGIVFCDLHEAIEKHSDVLQNIFSRKAIKPSDDKYAALNSALFSNAWLVYVPKETSLPKDKPLRVRFYVNSMRPHLSQTWIYAEKGSEVSLLTETYGAEISSVVSELVEAYVLDNSSVTYSNIQNCSHETIVLSNKRAICGKDAQMAWTLGNFGGSTTRSRLESVFAGDGAGAEVVEVVFGDGTQKFDIVSDLSHLSTHTKGRILSNAVLKDSSLSIFKGMIRIGKEAKNSSAYLAGHGILLSPNAKSDAIPGLEIKTNEVKATHSASVAQIDEEQIFYMMTRGMSEDEAKKFIVLGFLEPGISRIQSEDLRDTMRDLIEAKWYGKRGLIERSRKEVLFEEEKSKGQQQAPKDIFEGHYKYR